MAVVGAVSSTAIILTQVWLALVSNPSDQIVAGSLGAYTEAEETSGPNRADSRSTNTKVVPYAGGRFRSVSVPGVSRTYACTLRNLDWATVGKIDGWMGQLCVIRDRSGRKLYGTFPRIQVYDYAGGSQMHDVGFTLTQVSYSEAV